MVHIIGGVMLWAADVCSRDAFAQPRPVSSISPGAELGFYNYKGGCPIPSERDTGGRASKAQRRWGLGTAPVASCPWGPGGPGPPKYFQKTKNYFLYKNILHT